VKRTDEEKNQLCPQHRLFLRIECIECHALCCDRCRHYLVNGRPWCTTCGARHLPPAGDEVKNTIIFLAKVLVTMGATSAVFLVLPFLLGKISGAMVVGYLLVRLFWFRNAHQLHGLRIDEIVDGRPNRVV